MWLRGERQTERTRLGKRNWGERGALECSCNQGLCAQEGPINPAVCLYISSDILKTTKNEPLGPGGLLRLPRERERESNRLLQSGVCNNSSTEHGRPESLSHSQRVQRKWLTSSCKKKKSLQPLFSIRDVISYSWLQIGFPWVHSSQGLWTQTWLCSFCITTVIMITWTTSSWLKERTHICSLPRANTLAPVVFSIHVGEWGGKRHSTFLFSSTLTH